MSPSLFPIQKPYISNLKLHCMTNTCIEKTFWFINSLGSWKNLIFNTLRAIVNSPKNVELAELIWLKINLLPHIFGLLAPPWYSPACNITRLVIGPAISPLQCNMACKLPPHIPAFVVSMRIHETPSTVFVEKGKYFPTSKLKAGYSVQIRWQTLFLGVE